MDPRLQLPVPPTRSCLYECSVMHHRLSPKPHRFRYDIFMLCLDLDELDSLHARLRTFSRNRWNLYTFRDDDHLRKGNAGQGTQDGPTVPASRTGDLKSEIRAWLATQGVTLPVDVRITLVTLPRVLGHIFNPVSFYFCHAADGSPLCAVTEVQNTFGELKPYLVPPDSSADEPSALLGRFRITVPKHFYVSPFSPLDLCFDFRLRTPDERLEIGVNDVTADGKTILVSLLTGTRLPLTDGQLLRLTAKYPLVTLRVITLIHWHALKLWWKRLPWYRKAADTGLQRDVFRPHATLVRAIDPLHAAPSAPTGPTPP
ncbi:MAG: DUF1365 domain-containing protein [Verrucomicrobiota bacterium]